MPADIKNLFVADHDHAWPIDIAGAPDTANEQRVGWVKGQMGKGG
ncbi:MAG: hypothetical protein V4857_01655 [Pseudomonadota bacterium]